MTEDLEMLWVDETFVNLTEHYRWGDSDPYKTFTDNIGKLFRSMQKEYGRCVGPMGIDRKDGTIYPAGWVFRKWMEYDDAKHSCCYTDDDFLRTRRCKDHYCTCCGRWTRRKDVWYIREVWVTVYRGDPHQVTRTWLESPVYALAS